MPIRIVLGSNWCRIQQCLHWMSPRTVFIGHRFNQFRQVQQLRSRKEKPTPRCHFEYELDGLCCQHRFKSNRVPFLQCLLSRPNGVCCWKCSLQCVMDVNPVTKVNTATAVTLLRSLAEIAQPGTTVTTLAKVHVCHAVPVNSTMRMVPSSVKRV